MSANQKHSNHDLSNCSERYKAKNCSSIKYLQRKSKCLDALQNHANQKYLQPHGKANRQSVAKALGLTERTLTQKLGEEKTSYNDVVDHLRRSLALEYVKEASISIGQIAWLLGYEGPTSFNNAFARWTGRSATEARSDNQRSDDGKVSKLSSAP